MVREAENQLSRRGNMEWIIFPFFQSFCGLSAGVRIWVFDIQVTSFLPLHKKIKIYIRSGIMSISCLMLNNREFEIQKG